MRNDNSLSGKQNKLPLPPPSAAAAVCIHVTNKMRPVIFFLSTTQQSTWVFLSPLGVCNTLVAAGEAATHINNASTNGVSCIFISIDELWEANDSRDKLCI